MMDNKLCSASIEVHELNERHTGSYVGAQMKELLNKWNIAEEKVVAFITDSGANMVSAIHQTFGKDRHIPCFAHLINLVTDIILKPKPNKDEQEQHIHHHHISAVIEKVREIVKWVKNSVNQSDELRKLQINAGESSGIPKKLILDVKIRWNSTYHMLIRFKELAGILNDLLLFASNAPIMVNAVEMVQIKEIILLLKPLEFITNELSGESYVTISKVIPLINCLMHNIETINLETDIFLEAKQQLVAELKKRFGKIEFNSIIAMATILDPRFKNVHFKEPRALANAFAAIKEMMKKENRHQHPATYTEQIEEKDANDFWNHH
ncbi:unnamed protein product [Acanthoscelides obtectus]|uniref:Uncharacterized protein n=1 Tax=Acanthoscelides obtectus TaxID=200917 RepID=A0A9P0KUF9_ACAOB|nr:unnamed protein product [Acanthoscelides obtectus]CAK1641641.1 Zinc finger BED domain-containing protein 4 [Acanthoscelides obtectus]